MRYFPQVLESGVFQYPTTRKIRQRVIENATPGGTVYRRVDHGHGFLSWDLTYDSITTLQRQSLDTFFEDCRGSLHSFLFLDPFQNLVRQSEAFEHSAWTKDTGVNIASGQLDPFGTYKARRITNATGISRLLVQNLSLPGWFPYCASVWLRTDTEDRVELMVHPAGSAAATNFTLTNTWKRYSIMVRHETSATELTAGLRLPSNTEIHAFGFQLEQLETVSEYKPTQDECGVHSDARFVDDKIRWVTTGVDHHSTRIYIQSPILP